MRKKTTKQPGAPAVNLQRMVRRLKRISNEMLQIGEDMDYYGGFGEIGQHGREMISASQMALDWARGMERDQPWLRKVLDDAKRAAKKLPKWAKPPNARLTRSGDNLKTLNAENP